MKKPISFQDLTVGSYIRKRLTKGLDMLCVTEITPYDCRVSMWKSGKPIKQRFTLTKKNVDEGDYVFVMQVKQTSLLK